MEALINVRRAIPSDAPAIAEVHVRSWQGAYRGLLPDSWLANLSVERRAAWWVQMVPNPAIDTFVAVAEDGTVVGFASLQQSRDPDALPDTGELTTLYVEPAEWGHGYGWALLQAVLDAARRREFPRLTLWVLKSNARARRFYERAGFTADGTEKTETRSEQIVLSEVRYQLEVGDEEFG